VGGYRVRKTDGADIAQAGWPSVRLGVSAGD